MTISRREAVLGTLAVVPALAAGLVTAKSAAAPRWTLPAKRQVRVVENTWIPMPIATATMGGERNSLSMALPMPGSMCAARAIPTASSSTNMHRPNLMTVFP
jgi:hypothetical protein